MPVSEYDQRILDITKELCLQLDIANYNPIFVSWEGSDSRSRVPVEFRYDECLIERNCVTVSPKMKDVLEPDEWRPIIASSLIFTKKLRRRGIQWTAIVFAFLLGIAVGLFYALPILLPEPFTASKGGSTYSVSVGAAFAPIMGLFLVTAGTVVISVIIARRLRVVADEKAADIVSTTSFLTTLDKVSVTMRQTGYRANRTMRGPIPLLPDIQTRIARLKKKSVVEP
jgi:hypothetical protein